VRVWRERLHRLQRDRLAQRELHSNILPGADGATGDDDCHDSAFANYFTIFCASKNLPQQSWLEPVDLLAGVSKSGDAYDRFVAEVKQRAGGKRKQINAARRHVLAHLTGGDRVAGRGDLIEELGMHEVYLSQVWLRGIASNSREMLDSHASVGITLDTPVGDQRNLVDDRLTEPVRRVAAHSYDGSG
jgi:hypothetical protein